MRLTLSTALTVHCPSLDPDLQAATAGPRLFCVVLRCAGCHNVKDRGVVSIVHYWFDNIEIEIAILMIMQIRLSINL